MQVPFSLRCTCSRPPEVQHRQPHHASVL
ncbi:hypothetical protein E2320_002806, partial [Naja naja]